MPINQRNEIRISNGDEESLHYLAGVSCLITWNGAVIHRHGRPGRRHQPSAGPCSASGDPGSWRWGEGKHSTQRENVEERGRDRTESKERVPTGKWRPCSFGFDVKVSCRAQWGRVYAAHK